MPVSFGVGARCVTTRLRLGPVFVISCQNDHTGDHRALDGPRPVGPLRLRERSFERSQPVASMRTAPRARGDRLAPTPLKAEI